MDIEKLKTDVSLWPEGAEFFIMSEFNRTRGWFFKSTKNGNFFTSDGITWESHSFSLQSYKDGRYNIIQRPAEQKLEELKPREMACFEQVAEVIGEKQAEIELQRVIDTYECHNEELKTGKLFDAFEWSLSPQGSKFWNTIDRVINPYELSEKEPLKSDKDCCKTVEISKESQDIYDILFSFKITNPAEQEAIKILLCGSNTNEDRKEAINLLKRAIELEVIK